MGLRTGRADADADPASERALRVWQELTGKTIELFVGDVTDYDFSRL